MEGSNRCIGERKQSKGGSAIPPSVHPFSSAHGGAAVGSLCRCPRGISCVAFIRGFLVQSRVQESGSGARATVARCESGPGTWGFAVACPARRRGGDSIA